MAYFRQLTGIPVPIPSWWQHVPGEHLDNDSQGSLKSSSFSCGGQGRF